MPGFIPKRKVDLRSDDIQGIEKDPQKLAFKYLLPIDSIRSIVRPKSATSKNADEAVYDVERNTSRPYESRAHAFLRYIGFPVAVKDGDFYNPGFDPNGTFMKEFNRSDINKKFLNSDIKSIINLREEFPEELRSLFARQDLSSSIYALLLSTLIRPFNNLSDDIKSLDVDNQEFNVSLREIAVADFFLTNSDLDQGEAAFLKEFLGANFTKGVHFLKPFVVDPTIDVTAMPAKNRIAVPFLKNKDALKVDQNVSVLRPGLELIIRERLRASEIVDTTFLETARQILNGEISPTNTFLTIDSGSFNSQDLISTVSALLGEFEIEAEDVDKLGDISVIQTEVISQLVRTLKSLMQVLYDSIQAVQKAQVEINWVPIPNPDGPELGARNAKLRRNRISAINNELDSVIVNLKMKKITAEHQTTLGQDIGNFASPFNVNTNDESLESINNNLKDSEQKRDKIANDAFVAMGNIELIMGEVSGLGLLDVISVYIALWAMSEESLISLLDNESFIRLIVNFPGLVTGAAQKRVDNSGKPSKDIVVALDDFESKLKNVLNFAEQEFLRKGRTDGEEAGGDIYPDS